MTVILFDTTARNNLYPFNQIRPLADIRTGIFTARERWSRFFSGPILAFTEDYLQRDDILLLNDPLFIDSTLYPSAEIMGAIQHLQPGHTLIQGSRIIASRSNAAGTFIRSADPDLTLLNCISYPGTAFFLEYPWQIFKQNDQAIKADFELITRNRVSQPLSPTNNIISPENIFLEEGAVAEYCLLNASEGPVYLGKNSKLLEGSLIRGSFALCEGAVAKMGSKIYGATTVGPYCTVGGEIKNTVFLGYSNKAHDGYLGDAVVGEWCNFGAGSSASNVKNSAGEVKIWNQTTRSYISAGTKCGVMMGDYSRCAINTSFNTGTVTGICASVFTEGLTPRHIANFSWGGGDTVRYEFEKAIRDISNWKKLKNLSLSDMEVRELKHIFDLDSGE